MKSIFVLISTIIIVSLLGFNGCARQEPTKEQLQSLAALLEKPLDLQEFKHRKKCQNNSGGGRGASYLFKPSHPGFYYAYFIFDGFGESGPFVLTYKTNKSQNCMTPDEVLIEVSSDWPDKDLGKCNLVGESARWVLSKFGPPSFRKGEFWAYQQDNTLLLLKMGETVQWFQITKLSAPFPDFDAIERTKSLIPNHIRDMQRTAPSKGAPPPEQREQRGQT